MPKVTRRSSRRSSRQEAENSRSRSTTARSRRPHRQDNPPRAARDRSRSIIASESSKNDTPVAEKSVPPAKQLDNGRYIDSHCWICHCDCDEDVRIVCDSCARVYHINCLPKNHTLESYKCDCKRSSISGKHVPPFYAKVLGRILDFACKNVINTIRKNKSLTEKGVLKNIPFQWTSRIPDTYKFGKIMDVAALLDKTKSPLLRSTFGMFKSTGEIFAEAKWIYHQVFVMCGPDHDYSRATHVFEKIFRLELIDIEACPECYLNKVVQSELEEFVKKNPSYINRIPDHYFTKICIKPHDLVWAKLRGSPFWPAKCLWVNNGHVDVRFFGTHDKSVLLLDQVFKLSKEPPKKQLKPTEKYMAAIKELGLYIKKYRDRFGCFQYADQGARLTEFKKKGKSRSRSRSAHGPGTNEDSEPNQANQEQAASNFLNLSVLHDPSVETKVPPSLLPSVTLTNCSYPKNGDDVDHMMQIRMMDTVNADIRSHFLPDDTAAGSLELENQTEQVSVTDVIHVVSEEPAEDELEIHAENIENNVKPVIIAADSPLPFISPSDFTLPDITSTMSPIAITSTHSISESASNFVNEVSASHNNEECITTHRAIEDDIHKVTNDMIHKVTGDTHETHKVVDDNTDKVIIDITNATGQASVPIEEGGDDDVRVIGDVPGRKTFVELSQKGEPINQSVIELLFANKPSLRSHMLEFNNSLLQCYLEMWLEVNSNRLDSSDFKSFMYLHEKIVKKVGSISKECKLKEEEIAALKAKVKAKDKDIATLMEKVEDLEKKKEDDRNIEIIVGSTVDAAVRTYRAKVAALEKKLEFVESQNRTLEDVNGRLKESLDKYTEACKDSVSLQASLEIKTDELNVYQHRVKELEASQNPVIKEIKDAESQTDSLLSFDKNVSVPALFTNHDDVGLPQFQIFKDNSAKAPQLFDVQCSQVMFFNQTTTSVPNSPAFPEMSDQQQSRLLMSELYGPSVITPPSGFPVQPAGYQVPVVMSPGISPAAIMPPGISSPAVMPPGMSPSVSFLANESAAHSFPSSSCSSKSKPSHLSRTSPKSNPLKNSAKRVKRDHF